MIGENIMVAWPSRLCRQIGVPPVRCQSTIPQIMTPSKNYDTLLTLSKIPKLRLLIRPQRPLIQRQQPLIRLQRPLIRPQRLRMERINQW
jgi:hypothetical protein